MYITNKSFLLFNFFLRLANKLFPEFVNKVEMVDSQLVPGLETTKDTTLQDKNNTRTKQQMFIKLL